MATLVIPADSFRTRRFEIDCRLVLTRLAEARALMRVDVDGDLEWTRKAPTENPGHTDSMDYHFRRELPAGVAAAHRREDTGDQGAPRAPADRGRGRPEAPAAGASCGALYRRTHPFRSRRHVRMPFTDSLHPGLRELRTRPLLAVRLAVRGPMPVIATPGAARRIGVVTGGEFDGERLSGSVMEGGSDWQTLHADGSIALDVRLILKTTDDAHIPMTYRGVRHGTPEVIARVDRGEVVDPAEIYFRSIVQFETAAPQYAWLNHLVAVGIGQRRADGPVYSVFEVPRWRDRCGCRILRPWTNPSPSR